MRCAAATLYLQDAESEMSDTWQSMTAADLGRAIGRGEIDPVALCAHFLDAIAGSSQGNNIYARLTADRAFAEAEAAKERARQGQRRSVLDGVPISWKDLFDTAGTVTEAGSNLLKGRVPSQDADVLQNATQMGLVCLGKTHMSELAFSGIGLNPVMGTPPCINDEAAVPGGSSSGAAASVAFGLAPAAIGSDTGGSVRVPAVWSDLVGLKTTSGRLSLGGVVPLAAKFDTVGPLCRSVEDAALLLGVLEGQAAPDLRGADLAGRRFLVLQSVVMEDLRAAPEAAFKSAVERLQAAGATIERKEIPAVTEAMSLAPVLYASEAYATWKDTIEANPDVMFARILERFRAGAQFSAVEYVQASQRLDVLRKDYLRATAAYDAVIFPTCANLPPNITRLLEDDQYYVTENLLTLRNTRMGNLMGLTALTLPTGVPSTGISFNASPGTEHRLLRLGAAAEMALA